MVFVTAFGLVLASFLAFETRYKRPAVARNGVVIITHEFGATQESPR
jgi:hypothetical protein